MKNAGIGPATTVASQVCMASNSSLSHCSTGYSSRLEMPPGRIVSDPGECSPVAILFFGESKSILADLGIFWLSTVCSI